jgi:membrane protein implicated in regulation of membrane protease activity
MLVVGALLVVLHLIVIGALVIWFGLDTPTTAAKFRERFKAQFLSRHKDTDL